jgi:signal transduction histidine kinase
VTPRRRGEDGPGTEQRKQGEMELLRARLSEAEDTLDAIRNGAVDAFIVDSDDGEKILTLRGADRPYQILVETMLQGALILCDDATVLFANGRMAELIGVPVNELCARPLTAHFTRECRRPFEALLARGLEQDSRADLEMTRAGGIIVPVHVTASRLPLDTAMALTVTVTDLTREKAHEELERAHHESRASEAQLRLADQQKDEFLATLASELRNPLGPVRSLVEVLRHKGAATPDVEWAQNVIDRQIQRMSRMVDELLDLSGIAHDRIDLAWQAVTLSSIVDAALDDCAPLFEEWGHEIVVSLPEGPVPLRADRSRLTKVFTNLLTNAANSSNRFGRIEVTAALEGDAVSVVVRDNGAGIPAAQLPHIFDMFARNDRSVKGEQTSLGIGLALARRLVTLHGGTVEAESDGPGTGSCFTVRLPLFVTEPEKPGVNGVRILIVDDHADSADALATMLRMQGHEVRAVYDGEDALETGADFEPRVVLLDLAMPGIDGYTVCGRIRSSDWGERAHVIAVTGRGLPDDRRRTQEAGFDHHLVKPVDPAALTGLLASLNYARLTPRAGSARASGGA